MAPSPYGHGLCQPISAVPSSGPVPALGAPDAEQRGPPVMGGTCADSGHVAVLFPGSLAGRRSTRKASTWP